jgi:serine/threonine protein kinase
VKEEGKGAMHKYRLVAKKGEGTFSEVLKAQCIKNGKYVAIKCMKNHFDSLDQVRGLALLDGAFMACCFALVDANTIVAAHVLR